MVSIWYSPHWRCVYDTQSKLMASVTLTSLSDSTRHTAHWHSDYMTLTSLRVSIWHSCHWFHLHDSHPTKASMWHSPHSGLYMPLTQLMDSMWHSSKLLASMWHLPHWGPLHDTHQYISSKWHVPNWCLLYMTLTPLRASIWAPCNSRYRATWDCPRADPRCRAVLPFCKRKTGKP